MKPARWPQADADAVLLEPIRDPVTGKTVYALAPHPAGPGGRVPPPPPAGANLALTPEGDIVADGGDDTGHGRRPVSRIPQARMAAASWDEIAQALRVAEEGKPGVADVELRPGGQLVVTGRGKEAGTVSRLPQARMAAVNPGPSEADVALLRRLDPGNAEGWAPVLTDLVAGWTFRLAPPFPGQDTFVFFAFRSPSDGNAYRIAVLRPDMDAEFGHAPHMIRAHVGGRKIPVICGPGGLPAAGLAEVRAHAAKWMAYTSARMAGRNPGFSL